jgi:myo-inositol catabolism protein IolC
MIYIDQIHFRCVFRHQYDFVQIFADIHKIQLRELTIEEEKSHEPSEIQRFDLVTQHGQLSLPMMMTMCIGVCFVVDHEVYVPNQKKINNVTWVDRITNKQPASPPTTAPKPACINIRRNHKTQSFCVLPREQCVSISASASI